MGQFNSYVMWMWINILGRLGCSLKRLDNNISSCLQFSFSKAAEKHFTVTYIDLL